MRLVNGVCFLLLLWAIDLLAVEKHIDFQIWHNQPYTKDMISEDFKDILFSDSFIVEKPKNLYIDDKGNLSFKMLKNKVWIEGSGAQVILPIKPIDELFLTYAVYFDGYDDLYEWTSGGKLPGVAGGRGYTGGDPATKGDGFSARLMFGSGGQVFAYVYHKDMLGKYGDPLGIVAYNILKQYEWNIISIRIKMNTASDYNGTMEVWVNNKHIGKKEAIRFCTNGCQIDKFLLVAFHGGQSPDYRPSKDQAVKFTWFVFGI